MTARLVFAISDADPRPIYVQIMDEIRRSALTGSLRADDALPSVRQLAAQLRVNPNTVQQAYRELEREGAVYVQRGQGTYVAEAMFGRQQRSRLLAEVAARAVVDATRNGFTAAELIEAIRREEDR